MLLPAFHMFSFLHYFSILTQSFKERLDPLPTSLRKLRTFLSYNSLILIFLCYPHHTCVHRSPAPYNVSSQCQIRYQLLIVGFFKLFHLASRFLEQRKSRYSNHNVHNMINWEAPQSYLQSRIFLCVFEFRICTYNLLYSKVLMKLYEGK